MPLRTTGPITPLLIGGLAVAGVGDHTVGRDDAHAPPLFGQEEPAIGQRCDRVDFQADLADIEQPVVDLTPAPAVSSFVFYEGDAFPAWRGQMLVGSLRAADLFRVRIDGDRFVEKETLIEDLARVRDVEVGVDGLVYLLLEHAAGWTIARLVPAVAG